MDCKDEKKDISDPKFHVQSHTKTRYNQNGFPAQADLFKEREARLRAAPGSHAILVLSFFSKRKSLNTDG